MSKLARRAFATVVSAIAIGAAVWGFSLTDMDDDGSRSRLAARTDQARESARSQRAAARDTVGDVDAAEAFEEIQRELAAEPGVESGTGFGKSPGLTVGGKIFVMLVRDEFVAKLPRERLRELVEAGDGEPLRIGEREMREWVAVARVDPEAWRALAREALAFVRGGSG